MGGRHLLGLDQIALKRRRTKIVATVGPASSSPEVLARLVAAGVDVFRLNFSHGDHDTHGAAFRAIRGAARDAGHHVGVLADLCGPKIRVGAFEGGGIFLEKDEEVVVTTRDVLGRTGLIPSRYEDIARDVRPGDRMLLDDGRLELRAESVEGDDIRARVVIGGRLTGGKGINLPGVDVSAPALTPKDREDARFAASLGVDFVALSFVRRPDEIRDLRRLLLDAGARPAIVAKIEKPEAVESIDGILDAADAIMVARGDLGVELPAEEIPILQLELIRRAVAAQKPVIVATQMLESMIEDPRPTRAEVSDVASAAQAMADAVMLSAETAAGSYPVEAVATMDRVLRLVEGYQWGRGEHGRVQRQRAAGSVLEEGEALSRATSLLSGDLGVRAIVVPSRTGTTAGIVASERPAAPVVALTASEETARRLALVWGITPRLASLEDLEDPRRAALAAARDLGLADPGHPVLMVWDPTPSAAPASDDDEALSVQWRAGEERQAGQPTVSILRAE